MILGPRVLAPLLLAATVLGTTAPILQAMAETSSGIFYGRGIYVLTQRDQEHPLDGALVEDLRNQPWVQGVSPEAYAPTTLGGQGLVIRGIDPGGFAAVEGLTIMEGSVPRDHFILAGVRLASRLHLRVNQTVVLTGSLEIGITQVRVTGVVATGGPSEDELFVPVRLGAWLATSGPQGVATVRVRTSNPQALVAFLRARGNGANISGQSSSNQGDDRIANLILLNPRLSRTFGQHYVGTLAQYGINSVRVALDGFIMLTVVLFSLGSAATLGKELEEGRGGLGLLKALGATRWGLTSIVLGDVLPAAATSSVGVALGLFLAGRIGALRPILLFGHTLVPGVDLPHFILLGSLAFGAVTLMSLLLAHLLWRRPIPDLLVRPSPGRGRGG